MEEYYVVLFPVPLKKWFILKKIFGYLAGDVNAADQDYSYHSSTTRLLSGEQIA